MTVDLDRPAPFSLAPRWGWVSCDLDDFAGFAIYTRTNLTIGEREELGEAHDAIVAGSAAFAALPPEEQAATPSPADRERELLAPLVRDWNAVGLDAKGKEKPIPAPADGGPEAFKLIERRMWLWIVRTILVGYAGGKGAKPSAGQSPPTSGPQTVPDGG